MDEALEQACRQVTKLRADLWEVGGYRPVAVFSPGATLRDGTPIKSAGKRPVSRDWPELALRDPPDAVIRTASALALNTGLLCGELVGVDVDVLDGALVEEIAGLVASTLGPTPLQRIGRSPKILFCYRTLEPFSKVKTAVYVMPDGSEGHLEILGAGQQFVAYGVHPDTMRPYQWPGRSPLSVPLAQLPVIDAMAARDLIGAAGELLRAAGGVPKTPPPTEPPPVERPPRRPEDENFFSRVNAAALASLESWVPAMLPAAKFYSNKRSWRVTSQALDRDYEEDLSFAPDGIRDFGDDHGDHNGRGLTAIDAIMEFGAATDPVEAALWLCTQLGIAPTSLGWRAPTQQKNERKAQEGVRAKLPPPEPDPGAGGGGGDSGDELPPPGAGGSGDGGELPPPNDRGGNEGGDDDDPAPKLRRGVSLNDFFAVMTEHRYVYIQDRNLWPADSINGRFGKIQVRLANAQQARVKAAAWLDMHRPVEGMTWAPGKPMILDDTLINQGGMIAHEGVRTFNLYLPPPMRHGDPRKARRWLRHVLRVYPDKDDARHILNWLAHRVQHPEEKINHALVLGGEQGVGKDTIVEPVKRAVGTWNGQEESPRTIIERQFNGYLKAVILRISEARDLGDTQRRVFYEHTKALLAAPPDVLRVNEKNRQEYYIPNVVGVVITTNHKTDGIYLPDDDRRHYVAWSSRRRSEFSEQYFIDLYRWLDDGGDCSVAAYLAQLDLSGFDPKAPPPQTQAFWDIVNASQVPESRELADLLDGLDNPDAVTLASIINGTRTPYGTHTQFGEWLKDRRNSRKIPHRMENCGYVAIKNPDAKDGFWKILGTRHVIYAKLSLTPAARLKSAEALAKRQ